MNAMAALADDDRLIADSATAFLDRSGGVGRARRRRDDGTALDRGTWAAMADLGWFGLLVPEEAGGLGLTLRDLAVLMEAVGRHLPPEPIGPGIAAAAAIAAARPLSPALERVVAGTLVVIPVDAPDLRDGGGVLDGASAFAGDLAAADAFLVAAGRGDGTRLLLLPAGTPGLRAEWTRTVDGGSAGRLHLTGLRPEDTQVLAAGTAAERAAGLAADVVRLAHAGSLVGLADAALTRTLAFMNERRQFGTSIGSFQALQHRAASLYVAISSARALLHEAARPADRTAACAAAKLLASETALRVSKECIQLHGAIGFTDEHDIGLFLRRAMALAAMDGTADDWLRAFAARGG